MKRAHPTTIRSHLRLSLLLLSSSSLSSRLVLADITCGLAHGYDRGDPAYFYSGDGTLSNFDACSAECQGSSECESFAFGDEQCLLYAEPLDTNFREQNNSPFLFYDRDCQDVQATSTFLTVLPTSTTAASSGDATTTSASGGKGGGDDDSSSSVSATTTDDGASVAANTKAANPSSSTSGTTATDDSSAAATAASETDGSSAAASTGSSSTATASAGGSSSSSSSSSSSGTAAPSSSSSSSTSGSSTSAAPASVVGAHGLGILGSLALGILLVAWV